MKTLLSLTAAAVLFCAPVAFADDADMSTTPDSTMSTDTTSTPTDETTASTADVQLQTSDGRTINGTFTPSDLTNLKTGDKLEIVTLPSASSTTPAATDNATDSSDTGDSSNSTDSDSTDGSTTDE